jgi:hypothetical protein
MTCPKCQTKNLTSARHCVRCGALLTGEWQLNKGCLIPIVLIGCTLLASIALYLWIKVNEEEPAPYIEPYVPWRPTTTTGPTTIPIYQPTTHPAQPS